MSEYISVSPLKCDSFRIPLKMRNYIIDSQLAVGSYSGVFKGHNEENNMVVAIKTLPKQYLVENNMLDNLHSNIRIYSSLNHRNIARLYEFF